MRTFQLEILLPKRKQSFFTSWFESVLVYNIHFFLTTVNWRCRRKVCPPQELPLVAGGWTCPPAHCKAAPPGTGTGAGLLQRWSSASAGSAGRPRHSGSQEEGQDFSYSHPSITLYTKAILIQSITTLTYTMVLERFLWERHKQITVTNGKSLFRLTFWTVYIYHL